MLLVWVEYYCGFQHNVAHNKSEVKSKISTLKIMWPPILTLFGVLVWSADLDYCIMILYLYRVSHDEMHCTCTVYHMMRCEVNMQYLN